MQCFAVSRRFKPAPIIQPTPEVILPYYGLGPETRNYTQALILSLQYRGDTPSRYFSFELSATIDKFMYYAYPVEYGEAKFIDRDSSMEGGWDGAFLYKDVLGPAVVNVTLPVRGVVPFYLYRADWPWNGSSRWTVK